jgi:isochorismate pyruvate lyase
MSEQTIKNPENCESMRDVRQAIDSLDEQLLTILGQRIKYIERAAQIKTSIDTIRDDERIDAIIAKRSAQAAEYGYSDEIVASLFRALIEYSVAHEMQVFKNKGQIADPDQRTD